MYEVGHPDHDRTQGRSILGATPETLWKSRVLSELTKVRVSRSTRVNASLTMRRKYYQEESLPLLVVALKISLQQLADQVPDSEHTDEGETAKPASAAAMRGNGPFKSLQSL